MKNLVSEYEGIIDNFNEIISKMVNKMDQDLVDNRWSFLPFKWKIYISLVHHVFTIIRFSTQSQLFSWYDPSRNFPLRSKISLCSASSLLFSSARSSDVPWWSNQSSGKSSLWSLGTSSSRMRLIRVWSFTTFRYPCSSLLLFSRPQWSPPRFRAWRDLHFDVPRLSGCSSKCYKMCLWEPRWIFS